jgi:iron-sulfur cluster assembly protein
MALDESKDTDEKFDIDGYTYVVEKEFLAQAKPIKVDFLDVGFKVTSSIKLDSACGSCGDTGSCCS